MSHFAYTKARDVVAAVASGALHTSDRRDDRTADFFAGGTDMMQLVQERLRTPARVVDITALPGLSAIDVGDGGLTLGALVRMSDAAAHAGVCESYPVIAEALLASASAQVRNLATLGGNLLQRTRCGYFRDADAPCNKREPGTGCPARLGRNRDHAIFGGSEQCVATYAGDFAIALLVLDADVVTIGPMGERRIPLGDLHRTPGETPSVETQLAPGELIVRIDIPASGAAARSHYLKVRDRASFQWSIASAAVALDLDDDLVVRDVRVAVGGVATKPWRVARVEAALRGRRLSSDLCGEAAAMTTGGAVGLGGNDHKIVLIERTVARALRETAGLA